MHQIFINILITKKRQPNLKFKGQNLGESCVQESRDAKRWEYIFTNHYGSCSNIK